MYVHASIIPFVFLLLFSLCLYLSSLISSCNYMALLERLIDAWSVGRLPVVYGARRFIAVFAGVRHWSLSWVGCIRSVTCFPKIEGVSKSFRIGRPERELQMVQLLPTRCSCIAILWARLVSSAIITFNVASQLVIPKLSVYLFMDWVRKPLDTPSFIIVLSFYVLQPG
jgi:hypothetical protein